MQNGSNPRKKEHVYPSFKTADTEISVRLALFPGTMVAVLPKRPETKAAFGSLWHVSAKNRNACCFFLWFCFYTEDERVLWLRQVFNKLYKIFLLGISGKVWAASTNSRVFESLQWKDITDSQFRALAPRLWTGWVSVILMDLYRHIDQNCQCHRPDN